MIKSFEEFANEIMCGKTKTFEEYGAPFFNEISESLMREINNSINEGKLVINPHMVEEGLFDTIGNLFKKSADKVENKIEDGDVNISDEKKSMKKILDAIDSTDIADWDKDNRPEGIDDETYEKIESLCKEAENICKNVAKKEETDHKTIGEKLSAANEAIKDFMSKAIKIITAILIATPSLILTAIWIVQVFCVFMFVLVQAAIMSLAVIAINTIVTLYFTLPIMLAFAIYKGVLKVCEMLADKIEGSGEIIKNAFGKIKTAIVNWVVDSLKKAKNALKKACDSIKDGSKKAYNAVGKAYITIAAVIGQLASDAKDKISEAYTNFIDGAKDFRDEVKTFISDKLDVVSKWCKDTGTAFAEGVKNVWGKIKDKVVSITDGVKESHHYYRTEIMTFEKMFGDNIVLNDKLI